MNTVLKAFIITIALSITYGVAKPNKLDTATFKVDGVCGMCKDRIENGALIKGVKFVEWDKETQMVTIIYKAKKLDEMDLHQSIAEVGHDTEMVKAKEEVYTDLPMCCAYRDGAEPH